jgi:hypothetical protein
MPIARIITSRPEVAEPVADSLRDSGYAVEITTPEQASFKPVDDETAGAAQYGDNDDSYLAQPRVIEREFILAPLWRNLKAHLAPLFGRGPRNDYEDAPVSMSYLGLDPERERSSAPMQSAPPQQEPSIAAPAPAEEPQPEIEAPMPAIFDAPAAPLVQPVQQIEEPEAPVTPQSEAVEAPPAREPAFFNQRGFEPAPAPQIPAAEKTHPNLRPQWHEQFEPQSPVESSPEPATVEPIVSAIASSEPIFDHPSAYAELEPGTESASPVVKPAEHKTPALVLAAIRLEEMRNSAAKRFAEWRTRPRVDSKQPLRDYIWRQAFPAAAGLAVAFLIGWTAAVHSGSTYQANNSSPQVAPHAANSGFTVGPQSPSPTGGYTVGPQGNATSAPQARKPSAKTNAVVAKHGKPSARRRSRDYSAEDDVVIHHYSTAKPKVPEVHRASLKRYSDIN